MITQERPITADISSLQLEGTYSVRLTPPGAPALKVIGIRQDDIDNVVTLLQGNKLIIRPKPNSSSNRIFNSINISGGIIRINGVEFGSGSFSSGEVSIEVTLPHPVTDVSVTGTGDLTMEAIQQDDLDADLTGTGTLKADGKVKNLTVHLTGTGDVKMRKLIAENAKLTLTGTGDIKVNVTNSVKARLSGTGDITIEGNPAKRDTNISGLGNIEFD